MGLTLNQMKANLARERQVVKDMIGAMKATRDAIKSSRAMQKALRAEIRREMQIDLVPALKAGRKMVIEQTHHPVHHPHSRQSLSCNR